MARPDAKAERPCVYCGHPAVRVGRGEHIVQDAIGGKLTINEVNEGYDGEVCNECNHGPLSEADRELR